MSVSHLPTSDQWGFTSVRVAWDADRLDALVPGWVEHIDCSRFASGTVEGNPIAQVRANVLKSDPRWFVLAEMLWGGHPVFESHRLVWRKCWESETARRLVRLAVSS